MVADLSHLHSECVHTVVQMPSIVQGKGLAFPQWCSWASSNNWSSLLAGVWLVLGGWSSFRWLVILWDVSPGSCEPLEKLQHPLPSAGAVRLWLCLLFSLHLSSGWMASTTAISIWAEVQLHFVTAPGHKGIKCCCVVGKMSFIWGSLCSVCCHSASAVPTSLTFPITLSGKETSHIRTESFSKSTADVFSFSKRSVAVLQSIELLDSEWV